MYLTQVRRRYGEGAIAPASEVTGRKYHIRTAHTHTQHIYTTCTPRARFTRSTYTLQIPVFSRNPPDSPQELPRCHPYPLRTLQILQFLPRSSPDPPTSAQIPRNLPQSSPNLPQILPRGSPREILEHLAKEGVTFLKIQTLYTQHLREPQSSHLPEA